MCCHTPFTCLNVAISYLSRRSFFTDSGCDLRLFLNTVPQAFIINLSMSSICHSCYRNGKLKYVYTPMCVLHNYLEEPLKYIYLYVRFAFQNIETTSRNRSIATQYHSLSNLLWMPEMVTVDSLFFTNRNTQAEC